MAFVLPEAAVEVPEAAAAAPALLAWIGRFGQLAGMATTLLGVLFGSQPAEPATGNAMRPIVNLLAYPQRAIFLTLFYVNVALDQTSQALTRMGRRIAVSYLSALRTSLAWVNAARREATAQAQAVQRYAYGITRREELARHDAVVRAERAATAQAQAVQRYAYGITRQEELARHDAVVRVQAEDRLYALAVGGAVQRYAYGITRQEALARHDAVVRTDQGIRAAVVQPVRATWPVLVTELGAATAAAGTELPGLRELISAVPKQAPASLEAAAADPLAITRVLTRALTDCTIPNCRNLSKYGRDLHGLGELLGAAGLVAFLAYAVAHPHEAAVDTENTAVALLDGTVHEVERLLGV